MNEMLTITPQMIVVMGLLAVVIVLFITEVVRIDVAAITAMIFLGLLSLVPSLEGLVEPDQLFNGFSSNAVIAIMAVMIMGAGLDKTGVMKRVAISLLRFGGRSERRIVPLLSLIAGAVSGFIQNAGAAALFLPILSRISTRTGIALSRLLMPVGFCILLGGTITLVGSSPLVILNDLLPEDIEPFSLFDVAPVGLALLVSGILYFSVVGNRLLPTVKSEGVAGESTIKYFESVYGLNLDIREVQLESHAPWKGKTVGEIERASGLVVVATFMKGELRVGPWSGLVVEPRAHLAVLGRPELFDKLGSDLNIAVKAQLDVFGDVLSPLESGISEVVVPPNSQLTGKTVTEIAMRKTYGLSVLAIHRGEKTIREDLREVPLQAGDTLVCHSSWGALSRVEKDRHFVVVTSAYPHVEMRPQKVYFAICFFALSLGLLLFTDLRISIAFFAGALGMILTGVLTIDEAYRSIGWRTVFLLGSLIPLGQAVESSGTAMWIAQEFLEIFGQTSPLFLQFMIAILVTLFTLVMTNVGSTVLLVPFSINIALAAQSAGMDADPRIFALTVAVVATNGFILPTNQVMSIFFGPGGYRVNDVIKVGTGMSVIFLIVSLVMLNIVF